MLIHGFGVKTDGGALIGFSYSEITFLIKNIVKCPKINAICCQSIYFFQFFFCFEALQMTQSYNFFGLSGPSLIKCICENTKYKHVFRAMWRYFYDYISSTGHTYKAKIAQRIFCERDNDKVIRIYYSKGKDLKRE